MTLIHSGLRFDLKAVVIPLEENRRRKTAIDLRDDIDGSF